MDPNAPPAWASATTPDATAPAWANTQAAPSRAPGATGLGMIGQTFHDLTSSGPADHDPNAIERGIMGANDSHLFKGAVASYQSAVQNGLLMQPVRAAMEGLGVGRQPGETNESLHNRYNQAVTSMRADSAKAMADNNILQGNAAPSWAQKAQRFGQQTLNVGANIVANPEYFLLPGMSAGANVATRIGTATAGNAAVGSVSDAAAQLMDIAEGQKKKFDVQQNLQSSASAGAFGGALHGAIEVAPFVRDLFATRGVDTTPAADPRGTPITPMSTDHVSMNQADHAQYQQLLQSGSVDDIKQFFQGKNGPQPSWADVNTWVEHREGATRTGPVQESMKPDFNYADEYNNQAEQGWKTQNRQAVEDHVNNQMSSWKNSPDVEVVHGPGDIQDPEVRAQALKEDAKGDALGFLGSDGKVRMFSGRITDPETANAVLFHEGLGHYGLAQKFGDRLDQTLQTLMDRNVNQFSKRVDKWQAEHPGAYKGDRVRAAEEVLAEDSQNGQIKPSWQNAISSSVRQFGRKMGLKLAYSDAEVQHILAMAHDAVVNGTTPSMNGFKGATQDPAKSFEGSTSAPAQESGVRWSEAIKPEEPDISHLVEGGAPLNFSKGETEVDAIRGAGTDHMSVGPETAYIAKPNTNVREHLDSLAEKAADFGGKSVRADTAYQFKTAEAREAFIQAHENAEGGPKFITRSQLASQADYKADDLEGIYRALDEGYTPTTRTFEEDRQAALAAGFSPKQIKALKEHNPGDLSTRLYRMQAAANMADLKLKGLNEKLDTPAWSEGDQATYIQTLADRNYLVTRIKGERAEIARALNVSKAAKSYTNSTMQQMAEILEQNGSGLAGLAADPTAFIKFARQVKQMMNNGNPAGAQVLIAGVNKPYWEQYLTTFHMNMMLSALSTHVKAPIDMGTGIARNVIEKALAIPVGKAREMFVSMTGRTPQPGVEVAELANHVGGIMRSVMDAEVYRRMLHAVKTGESSYVSPDGTHTPTNFANTFGATSNPRIPGISKPTDLISAQDTFFRSVEINAQLHSLATREARDQLGPGASTSDVMTLGHTIALNPTPTMIKEAYELTNRTLLLNDNSLNNMINKARTYTPGMSPARRLGAFIVTNLAPFIRVESNSLVNRVIQRSPLGFIDPTGYTQAQLKAGGAKADIALTKIMYGTVLLGMSWAAADKAKNYLTGNGPTSVDKYKEKIAAGWRPNAVHEDGGFNTGGQLGMSVNPFDQHNHTAQLMASMRQAYEEGANKGQVGTGIKLALGSIISGMAEQSWVNDLGPAIEAVTARGTEGQSKVSTFVANEAHTWSPNALNQAARLTDSVDRDTTAPESISGHVANELQSTIPGWRQQLPIKYSVYGTPLANGSSLTGVHTIIPGLSGNGTTETHDPAERELDRLGSLVESALVTPVPKTITIDGEKKKLTPAEFENFQRVAGRATVETVRSEMSTDQWRNMSDQDRVLEVKSIQTDMKKAAREALFEK